MIARADIDGLILAGGRSRRMQSQAGDDVDKGLLKLQDKPLVHWVSDYMQPRVTDLYISANRNLDAYSRYGPCIQDDATLGNDVGPLAGLATALLTVQRPWLFVLPVDVPRVPLDLFDRLANAVGEDASLAYARAGQRDHPLCLVVRSSLGPDLHDYLQQGGRKVLDWHCRHDAVPVDFGDDPTLFRNINTPQELRAAARA